MNYRNGYHSAYANLASAIITSGVKCHDTIFLESNWCDTLRKICALDDEIYGDHNDLKGRCVASVSKRRGLNESD